MKHRMKTSLRALSCCALAACAAVGPPPQRFAMVVGVRPERLAEYRALHAEPWQGVLDQLDRCNVRNYSIWLCEPSPGRPVLFGYFDYVGDDFDADMAKMGEDESTQLWWDRTAPCQVPIETAGPDEQWVMMEEVFFHDAGRPGAARMPAPARFGGGRNDDGSAPR
jgi:L-rhamnose mutarotase